MNDVQDVNRRDFIKGATAISTAAAGAFLTCGLAGAADVGPAEKPSRKIKVGVIGCGSVSRHYFPSLLNSPNVELIGACDIRPERAEMAATKYHIPHHFPHIDKMLSGPHFDLLVNITDMQEHYRLSKQALTAGRNVWSEKPLGVVYAQAKELLELAKSKGVHILGAPTVVASPQFEFMLQTLREGTLGKVAAAHASYGHLGPTWSSFFYDRNGGSLFDLGVYNVATLTGLFGPAKSVIAMTSIVTPTRNITGKGQITVEAEDNAMLVLEHANGVLSHVQCGFNYYSAREHSETTQTHQTLSVVGTKGSMHLAGYDWAPHGVDLATRESGGHLKGFAADPHGYEWQCGAARMAAWLAGGDKPRFTAEHAAHLAEIMASAHESQANGKRIQLKSTFDPIPIG
jgi:predicted dehydrogenase